MPTAANSARRTCVALTIAAAVWASLSPSWAATTTARPGQNITIGQVACSAGFIIRNTSTHRRYLTTAGHCVNSSIRSQWTTPSGDRLWDTRHGPVVSDDSGATLGRVVYTTFTDTSDFTVIALSRGVHVDASIPNWGSVQHGTPTPEAGDFIRIYGQGEAVGTLAPAREGIITSVQRQIIRTALASLPGDSGCPVINATNQALGLLVALQPSAPPDTGLINVIRLQPMLARASTALHAHLVVD